MFLLKETTQWPQWGPNPGSRDKHSTTEPLRSHKAVHVDSIVEQIVIPLVFEIGLSRNDPDASP